MPDKLYTEDEVGAIIKRAVELQEQGHAQTYTPGVTEAELERIAREMGVSVEFLRKSIAEHGGQGAEATIAKLVFSKNVERVVDGELDPDDFDCIASELPASQSPQWQPAQIGRSLKATTMTGTNMANINVTARNGRTRIQVNTKPLLTTIFGGQAALFGTIIGMAQLTAHGNPAAGIAILAAGLATGLALFFGGLKSSNRAADKMADQLVKAVEDRLAETQPKSGLEERLAKAPSKVDDSPETAAQKQSDH